LQAALRVHEDEHTKRAILEPAFELSRVAKVQVLPCLLSPNRQAFMAKINLDECAKLVP
jgi:hypothetical protein